MTTRAHFLATTLAIGAAAGLWVRPPALTTAQAPQPVTAEAATQLGISVTIQPATYTVAALVDAIAAHFAPAVLLGP